MRGSSKSLPKYAKHKASGQAVVRLSGKDFYLGPHGTKASKLEYDRLIGEWLANGRQLPKSLVAGIAGAAEIQKVRGVGIVRSLGRSTC